VSRIFSAVELILGPCDKSFPIPAINPFYLSHFSQSFPLSLTLPKISGTCPVRCPFLFRSIPKRLAMTGSGLGRYAREASPRVPRGGGPGRNQEYPGSKTGLHFIFPQHLLIRKTIAHPIDAISGFFRAR